MKNRVNKVCYLLIAISVCANAFGSDNLKKQTGNSINSTNEISSQLNLGKHTRLVLVKDESSANREGKKYQLNLGLFGAAYGAHASSIEFGYFKDISNIITLSFTQLNSMKNDFSLDDEADEALSRSGNGNVFSLGLKSFTSNSFYIRPEIYFRNQYLVDSLGESFTIEDGWQASFNDYNLRDIGISFRIGNEWQWENFNIGCDWIGLNRTLRILEGEDNVDSSEEVIVSLLNFRMGASF